MIVETDHPAAPRRGGGRGAGQYFAPAARQAGGQLAGGGAAPHARANAGLHPSEGGATAADATAPFRTSLAALLTGHILRDGEVVLLILKPSMWFIVFASMRFAAAGLIVLIAAKLWVHDSRATNSIYYLVTFLLAGRVMWAVLQWMARLYVLTDLRIVRLSGVFNVEIFDCALRKVGQVRLTRTFREKLWRLGSIEIVPADESSPPSVWQTVKRPAEVHAKVAATVERAKQGGHPSSLD